MYCAHCGSEMNGNAIFCGKCGKPQPGQEPPPLEPTYEECLTTAIGPKNTEYYLKRFNAFDQGASPISWNWPAFFISFIWLLYRKMWLYAGIYFFAPPLIFLALFLLLIGGLSLPEDTAVGLAWLTQLAITFVVFPILANRLYYRVVQQRISAAKQQPDSKNQLLSIARTGGTSKAAFIGIALLLVSGIGIISAIAIPAYQDYTLRAQVAEGLNLAAAAKAAVTETVIAQDTIPSDRQAAGLSPQPSDTSGRYVAGVDVQNGRIDIFYGNNANSGISGTYLSITPYAVDHGDGSWSIVWRCGYAPVPVRATHELSDYQTGTVPPKYLPSACRP